MEETENLTIIEESITNPTNPTDEEKPWHKPLQNWARLNEIFEQETETLVDIMHPHFPTIQSFDYNLKEIKRVIAFGLSPTDAMIMLETDKLVKREKTADEKRLWDKRVIIQRRIGRVVGRLKYYMFGIPLNSSTSTQGTEGDDANETTADVVTTPSKRGSRKKRGNEEGGWLHMQFNSTLHTKYIQNICTYSYELLFGNNWLFQVRLLWKLQVILLKSLPIWTKFHCLPLLLLLPRMMTMIATKKRRRRRKKKNWTRRWM
jgi:hypothetical protein